VPGRREMEFTWEQAGPAVEPGIIRRYNSPTRYSLSIPLEHTFDQMAIPSDPKRLKVIRIIEVARRQNERLENCWGGANGQLVLRNERVIVR
jgi:hypothetical protein